MKNDPRATAPISVDTRMAGRVRVISRPAIDLRAERLRGGKYGNTKTWYGTRVFHSKKEADYAAVLDMRLRAKDIIAWEPQVRIPLIVEGEKVCVYVIDFVVTLKGGGKEYVEVKGHETDTWKLKWKLFNILIRPGIEAAGGRVTLEK